MSSAAVPDVTPRGVSTSSVVIEKFPCRSSCRGDEKWRLPDIDHLLFDIFSCRQLLCTAIFLKLCVAHLEAGREIRGCVLLEEDIQTSDGATEPTRRGAVPDILNTLLLRLCCLRYLPGQTLSEAALAAEFNVSRTPIRQALQHLSNLGLVESRNGVGTVVTEATMEQALELLPIRQQLALLFETTTDLDRFHEAEEKMTLLLKEAEDLRTEVNVQKFALLGLKIHKIVVSTISNSEFQKIWENSYYRASRMSYSVVESYWSTCIDLQISEIDAVCKIFKERDRRALAIYYNESIAAWTLLAKQRQAELKRSAEETISSLDEGLEEFLNLPRN